MLDVRVGQGGLTAPRSGTLRCGRTRWSVVLQHGETLTDEFPLSAIRSMSDGATGTTFGPWK
jgi:hypothetical protein